MYNYIPYFFFRTTNQAARPINTINETHTVIRNNTHTQSAHKIKSIN